MTINIAGAAAVFGVSGISANGARDIGEGHLARGFAQLAPASLVIISDLTWSLNRAIDSKEKWNYGNGKISDTQAQLMAYLPAAMILSGGLISSGLSNFGRREYKEGTLKLLAGTAIMGVVTYNADIQDMGIAILSASSGVLSAIGRSLWNRAPQIKSTLTSAFHNAVNAARLRKNDAIQERSLRDAQNMV